MKPRISQILIFLAVVPSFINRKSKNDDIVNPADDYGSISVNADRTAWIMKMLVISSL
jgi:hypothetical protein